MTTRSPTPVLTLHVLSPKGARSARISGIPQNIAVLNRVCTAQGRHFEHQAPAAVKDGRVELQLLAQSLTTLTTLQLPKLREP